MTTGSCVEGITDLNIELTSDYSYYDDHIYTKEASLYGRITIGDEVCSFVEDLTHNMLAVGSIHRSLAYSLYATLIPVNDIRISVDYRFNPIRERLKTKFSSIIGDISFTNLPIFNAIQRPFPGTPASAFFDYLARLPKDRMGIITIPVKYVQLRSK